MEGKPEVSKTLEAPVASEAKPLPSVGRFPTEAEIADWTGGIAGGSTVEKIFKAKINEYQQEYTKKFMPFDRACALIDMQEILRKVGEEKQRQPESALATANKLKVHMPDFMKYGSMSRFNLIGFHDAKIPTKKGSSDTRLIGIFENYTCKERGHNLSIRVPLNLWIERHPKDAREMGLVDKEGKLIEQQ